MTYEPVKIIKGGRLEFLENGGLHITGWTFDLRGRPIPPGIDPCQYHMREITIAVWAHLNGFMERELKMTVQPVADEAMTLVNADIEISAQRETGLLLERLGVKP